MRRESPTKRTRIGAFPPVDGPRPVSATRDCSSTSATRSLTLVRVRPVIRARSRPGRWAPGRRSSGGPTDCCTSVSARGWPSGRGSSTASWSCFARGLYEVPPLCQDDGRSRVRGADGGSRLGRSHRRWSEWHHHGRWATRSPTPPARDPSSPRTRRPSWRSRSRRSRRASSRVSPATTSSMPTPAWRTIRRCAPWPSRTARSWATSCRATTSCSSGGRRAAVATGRACSSPPARSRGARGCRGSEPGCRRNRCPRGRASPRRSAPPITRASG